MLINEELTQNDNVKICSFIKRILPKIEIIIGIFLILFSIFHCHIL